MLSRFTFWWNFNGFFYTKGVRINVSIISEQPLYVHLLWIYFNCNIFFTSKSILIPHHISGSLLTVSSQIWIILRSNEFEKKSYLLWFSTRWREFSIALSSIVANYDPEKAADISTLFDVGGIFGNLRQCYNIPEANSESSLNQCKH